MKSDALFLKNRAWRRLGVAVGAGLWVALVSSAEPSVDKKVAWKCTYQLRSALRQMKSLAQTESYADTVLVVDPRSTRAGKVPPSFIPAVVEGGVPVGVTGTCPDCQVTLACLENLDADDDWSVLSISNQARTTRRGELIRPGEVWLEHDDSDWVRDAPPYPEFLR